MKTIYDLFDHIVNEHYRFEVNNSDNPDYRFQITVKGTYVIHYNNTKDIVALFNTQGVTSVDNIISTLR